MDVLIERCAGLDVHKKTVVACIRTPGGGAGKRRRNAVRTFQTTMTGLEALREWLGGHGVTHAAMESTGVYWCPVHAAAGQRPPRQAGARPQDGREGLRVAGATAGVRPAQGQLRSAAGDP